MKFIEKYFLVFSTLLVPFLYVVVATSFYLVLYVRKNNKYKANKIQSDEVAPLQIKREVCYSVISLTLFCITGYLVFILYQSGYSLIYFDIQKYGVMYLFISIVLMMLFHDMYFYWTHRLLHLPGCYRKIHRIHHLSSNPSPFTSLAFHPVEAIIQAAVLPFMAVIIPAHPYSMFVFNIHGV